MDMELEFLHKNFTEKNPKQLIEHIQRMASGEAPFFSATLGLVYDKLIERVLVQPIAADSGPGKPTNQSAVESTPTTKTLDPTGNICSPSMSNTPLPPSQQPPTPAPQPAPGLGSEPEQDPVPLGAVWLKCFQCSERARVKALFDGLRCPQCPSRGSKKGRPFMRCPACNLIRVVRKDFCDRTACRARFA